MKYSRGACTNESKEGSDCYPCFQFCAGFMLDCMFAMHALFEQLHVAALNCSRCQDLECYIIDSRVPLYYLWLYVLCMVILGIRMRRVCLAQKNIRKYASRYPL